LQSDEDEVEAEDEQFAAHNISAERWRGELMVADDPQRPAKYSLPAAALAPR
jgi:hypothetical protein